MSARSPSSDQIRQQIDRGGADDKVDFPDPAAAPLGTDDEAAGRPPGRLARAAAARPTLRQRFPGDGHGWLVLVLIGVVAVATGAALLATL